jgi:hypothetical protein
VKLRKIITLATTGTCAVSLSLLGLGATAAHAENGVQPVTFEVTAGSLALAQTPTSTLLVQNSAVAMPATTVTDGRNSFDRSGAWTVTATASDLDESGGASIAADQITLAQSGSFTSGSGTIGALGLVSASADTIASVYTYTPTAQLATQTLPYSGSYTGTVTQTVV